MLKNYEAALKLLRICEPDDLLIELSVRTMFLKIFYETGNFDLMQNYISSLQTFIRRKKIIGYHRDLYLNFSNFFTKLISLPPGDRASKAKLSKQLNETERIAEKTWLRKQLE